MGSEKARAEYDEFEQYRIAPYWRERVRDKKKDFYRIAVGILYGIPIAVIIHSLDRSVTIRSLDPSLFGRLILLNRD